MDSLGLSSMMMEKPFYDIGDTNDELLDVWNTDFGTSSISPAMDPFMRVPSPLDNMMPTNTTAVSTNNLNNNAINNTMSSFKDSQHILRNDKLLTDSSEEEFTTVTAPFYSSASPSSSYSSSSSSPSSSSSSCSPPPLLRQSSSSSALSAAQKRSITMTLSSMKQEQTDFQGELVSVINKDEANGQQHSLPGSPMSLNDDMDSDACYPMVPPLDTTSDLDLFLKREPLSPASDNRDHSDLAKKRRRSISNNHDNEKGQQQPRIILPTTTSSSRFKYVIKQENLGHLASQFKICTSPSLLKSQAIVVTTSKSAAAASTAISNKAPMVIPTTAVKLNANNSNAINASPSPMSISSDQLNLRPSTGSNRAGGPCRSKNGRNGHTSTRQPITTPLISCQPKGSTGPLVLTEEEKRTLLSEGYPVPQKLPLTKQEEKSLKKIRRKIKNKISAQESRRKKKEYMDCLERKMDALQAELAQYKSRCASLETQNAALNAQIKKMHAVLGNNNDLTTVRVLAKSNLKSSIK